MATELLYRRKPTEDWVFDDLLVKDRTDAPQTIAGVVDFAATVTDYAGNVMWTNDTAGCTVLEVDPSTIGRLKYTRAKAGLTGIVKNARYKLDFVATIGGKVTAVPEDGYVIIEVI